MKKRAIIREIEEFTKTLFDELVDRVIEKYPSIPFESISCRYKEGDDYYDEYGNWIDSDDYSIQARITINENGNGQEVPDGGKG